MFANSEVKKEYFRLSMAIAKAKKEARDYQDLLVARNKLKNSSLKFKLNPLKIDLKESLNNSLNLDDLNQNLNNLNETLKRAIELLENFSTKVEIPSIKKELTKPVESKTASSEERIKELSLFIEPRLNERIKDYCLANTQTFLYASDFIKAAFLAYSKQELMLDETSYYSLKQAEAIKKNLKLDSRLRTIYDSLDNKRAKTNQILESYLKNL